MSGSSRVAELLNISPKEAVSFCEQVRTLSGLGAPLQYKTIAQYLAQNLQKEVSSAQTIAEIIRANKDEIAKVRIQKKASKETKTELPKTTQVRRKGSKAISKYHTYRPAAIGRPTTLQKKLAQRSAQEERPILQEPFRASKTKSTRQPSEPSSSIDGIEVRNSELIQQVKHYVIDESGVLINPDLLDTGEHRKSRDERLSHVTTQPPHLAPNNTFAKIAVKRKKTPGNSNVNTVFEANAKQRKLDDALEKANDSKRPAHIQCPECKATIKSAKFERHLAKAHPRVYRLAFYEKTGDRLQLSKTGKNEHSTKEGNLVKCPLCEHRTQYNVLFVHIQVSHPEVNPKIVMAKFNQVYKGNKPIEKDRYENELNELVKERERLKQGQDEPRDGGKYMGHMRREQGKFGSLPLYDDYSDEADAE